MDATTQIQRKANLRDYLAAERTVLVWLRTGLAWMGFGFVVTRFGRFLQQLHLIHREPASQFCGLSLRFGTVLIVARVILNVFAGFHHLDWFASWIAAKPIILVLRRTRSRLASFWLQPG